MKMKRLVYVISILFSPGLFGEKCDSEVNERKGHLSVGRSWDRQCGSLNFHLTNRSNLLYTDIDIKSPHSTRTCSQAIDKLILPEGTECCFQERFCKIYFYKGFHIRELTQRFKKLVQRQCNVTWTELQAWPPTFKINKHFSEFQIDIHYRFLTTKIPKSRNSDFEDPTEKIIKNYREAAIIPGLIGFLLLAAGAAYMIYRRRMRSRSDLDYDIAPYAIHVSVRRRSEAAFNFQNRSLSVGHYDVPSSNDLENEYMRPMKEPHYSEIDGYVNCKPFLSRKNYDVYDMAEPLSHFGADNSKNFQTFLSRSEMFLNSEKNEPRSNTTEKKRLSSPQFERRACSRSEGDLIKTFNKSEVEYGEIIGTINKDGKMERFSHCKDTYKSIRKNH